MSQASFKYEKGSQQDQQMSREKFQDLLEQVDFEEDDIDGINNDLETKGRMAKLTNLLENENIVFQEQTVNPKMSNSVTIYSSELQSFIVASLHFGSDSRNSATLREKMLASFKD